MQKRIEAELCNVALRKESVDRNALSALGGTTMLESLSARRAWIEIIISVTANTDGLSLSARRAWIEIGVRIHFPPSMHVALRKESVDRNDRTPPLASGAKTSLSARRAWIEISALAPEENPTQSRSPQGERG